MRSALSPPICALLLGGSACSHAQIPPVSGGPPTCEQSIAGTWQHEDNVGYRYIATDDGKVAHLYPRRVNADGSAATDQQVSNLQMDVTLERGVNGFQGNFRIQVPAADGGMAGAPGTFCPALFMARVTSCSQDRLVLQLEQSYALDPSCQRLDFGQADLVDHVLVRVKP